MEGEGFPKGLGRWSWLWMWESGWLPSLKLTANAPENRPSQQETIVFQPSIFRGELLVSGRVHTYLNLALFRDILRSGFYRLSKWRNQNFRTPKIASVCSWIWSYYYKAVNLCFFLFLFFCVLVSGKCLRSRFITQANKLWWTNQPLVLKQVLPSNYLNWMLCAVSKIQRKWLVSHPIVLYIDMWHLIYKYIYFYPFFDSLCTVWCMARACQNTGFPSGKQSSLFCQKGPWIRVSQIHWQTVFGQDPICIYTPRTQMTLVLIGKGLVLEGWPSKIEVSWVLGQAYITYICICIYYHISAQLDQRPVKKPVGNSPKWWFGSLKCPPKCKCPKL